MTDADTIEECLEEYARNKHHLSAWCESIRQFFGQHPDISVGPFAIVHSIRARMKDEQHLRQKLSRKLAEGDRILPADLLLRITDLAGVRVLHLYQMQFDRIHQVIMDQIWRGDWVLREPPVAYTWDPESSAFFEGLGIRPELKPSHYTSIHYVVKPRADSPLSCEIQVRTLFEEAWGEIDHQINYPEHSDVLACREQLKVLAKIVGASTRLGDAIIRSHNAAKQANVPAIQSADSADGTAPVKAAAATTTDTEAI